MVIILEYSFITQGYKVSSNNQTANDTENETGAVNKELLILGLMVIRYFYDSSINIGIYPGIYNKGITIT